MDVVMWWKKEKEPFTYDEYCSYNGFAIVLPEFPPERTIRILFLNKSWVSSKTPYIREISRFVC